MTLIADFDARFLLGIAEIDTVHRAFAALVNRLDSADAATFAAGFAELFAHTEEHFSGELALMRNSRFPATDEHHADHQRVLGDLHRFSRQVERGRLAMARAYLREQLPGWFALHAATMDSALAAHLKATAAATAGE